MRPRDPPCLLRTVTDAPPASVRRGYATPVPGGGAWPCPPSGARPGRNRSIAFRGRWAPTPPPGNAAEGTAERPCGPGRRSGWGTAKTQGPTVKPVQSIGETVAFHWGGRRAVSGLHLGDALPCTGGDRRDGARRLGATPCTACPRYRTPGGLGRAPGTRAISVGRTRSALRWPWRGPARRCARSGGAPPPDPSRGLLAAETVPAGHVVSTSVRTARVHTQLGDAACPRGSPHTPRPRASRDTARVPSARIGERTPGRGRTRGRSGVSRCASGPGAVRLPVLARRR